MIDDIQPGATGSEPGPVTAFNGTLIFNADVDGYGEEPFALTLNPPEAPIARLAIPIARGVSNDATPVVTGTAPAGSSVYLFADGTPIGNSVTGANGRFQVDSSLLLKNGTHLLTLSDEMNGLSSAASTPLKYAVDTVHPDVKFMSAAANSIVLKFSQNVSASFARGDFTISNIRTGVRIPAADIRVTYNAKKNTATISFKGLKGNALRTGHYRLRVDARKIADAIGNDLSADESYAFAIRKKK
jgi:hypothetical protein